LPLHLRRPAPTTDEDIFKSASVIISFYNKDASLILIYIH
jgi:hypothetical protein